MTRMLGWQLFSERIPKIAGRIRWWCCAVLSANYAIQPPGPARCLCFRLSREDRRRSAGNRCSKAAPLRSPVRKLGLQLLADFAGTLHHDCVLADFYVNPRRPVMHRRICEAMGPIASSRFRAIASAATFLDVDSPFPSPFGSCIVQDSPDAVTAHIPALRPAKADCRAIVSPSTDAGVSTQSSPEPVFQQR